MAAELPSEAGEKINMNGNIQDRARIWIIYPIGRDEILVWGFSVLLVE